MSAARRAGSAVAKAAGELWLHPDRLVHSLLHGRPESVAEHFAYMKSRAWVPEELEGRKAAFIAWAGIAYHVIVAWPLMTACTALISAATALRAAAVRPLSLLCLIVPCLFVYLILSGIL
jgi:hypothetical protein